MEQHKLHRKKGHEPAEELTVQYKDLLKELTSYQHAILIDLGLYTCHTNRPRFISIL